MACLIVPAAEAIVTTVASHVLEKQEKKEENVNVAEMEKEKTLSVKQPFYKKLHWLSNLLWGGSTLLAFEHVWHGEITPWFPFLTGASTPESTVEMLHEMSTAGVGMAALVTLVWTGMLAVSRVMEKRAIQEEKIEKELLQYDFTHYNYCSGNCNCSLVSTCAGRYYESIYTLLFILGCSYYVVCRCRL